MSWGAANERRPVRSFVRRRPAVPVRRTRAHAPAPSSISVLATQAATGDQAAVDRLLRHVREMTHRYCQARLGSTPGSAHTVDDAVQEVCLSVLDSIEDYRLEEGSFEAFVYTLASRRVADQLRTLYRVPVPVADIPDEVEIDPTPEEAAMASEDARMARDLLSLLPDTQRELLILRVVVGLSSEEVADVLDMTPGAVRVAQHRALSKLRAVVSSDDALPGGES